MRSRRCEVVSGRPARASHSQDAYVIVAFREKPGSRDHCSGKANGGGVGLVCSLRSWLGLLTTFDAATTISRKKKQPISPCYQMNSMSDLPDKSFSNSADPTNKFSHDLTKTKS